MHLCEEGVVHLTISFWHLLMNVEKLGKSDFWRNEKICWRYHHFTHAYQKLQSYEVEFLRSKVRQHFLSFWAIFCSCAPLLTLKIKIWKKCKKTSGDIILLHMCTINQDQMYPWYDTWFLRNEVQQTELSWIILKISKMKKNLEMSSFYTNVPKMMSIR